MRSLSIAFVLVVASPAAAQRLGLPDETLRWEVREWAKRNAIRKPPVDFGGGVVMDYASKATQWTETMPLAVAARGDTLEVDGRFTAQTKDGHNLNRLRMVLGPKYQMVFNYALADASVRDKTPYGVMVTPTTGHGAYAQVTAALTPMVSPFELTFLAGIDPTGLFYLTPSAYFTTKERSIEYSNANLDASLKSRMFTFPWRFVIRDDEQGRITSGECYEVDRKVADFEVRKRGKIGSRERPLIVVYRKYWPTKKGPELQTVRTFTLKEANPSAPLEWGIPASLQVVDYRLTTPDLAGNTFPLPEESPVVYKWAGFLPELRDLRALPSSNERPIDPRIVGGGVLGGVGLLLLAADTLRKRRRSRRDDLPDQTADGGHESPKGKP